MSKRNGWEDKEGRVFVRYTVSEVAGLLHCTQPTAMKVYRELEAIGLVERKKAKHGKSDLVFVRSYIS
jgi:DNA-binding MarR family transcriptional regulator